MPLYRAELLAKKPLRYAALLHDVSQVLYLPFDYDDGSYARDRSGFRNDGTIHGATLAAGKIGMCRSFDGVGNRIEVPDSPSVSVTGALAQIAWVKPTIGTDMGVISKDNATERSYYMFVTETGAVRHLISPDGASIRYHDSTIALTEEWHHIATVFVPNTRMTIYIDGVERGEITTDIPAAVHDGAQKLTIGLNERYSLYFKGLIDEPRILKIPSTSAELHMLMYRRLG